MKYLLTVLATLTGAALIGTGAVIHFAGVEETRFASVTVLTIVGTLFWAFVYVVTYSRSDLRHEA